MFEVLCLFPLGVLERSRKEWLYLWMIASSLSYTGRATNLQFPKQPPSTDLFAMESLGTFCSVKKILRNVSTILICKHGIPFLLSVHSIFALLSVVLLDNLAINRYNFLNREKRGGSVVTVALDELRECIIPGNNVEAYVENTLLGESIGAFLSNVTQLERIVFVRRYWFLDSIHEISTQCNLTETNVSTILHRLRKKLKSHLRKTGFMP